MAVISANFSTTDQERCYCTTDLEDLYDTIKKECSCEWLGEHINDYQSFLTSHIEADKFLESGQFDGELSDVMVRALTNVLGTPMVLFTSASDLPIIVTRPSHGNVTNIHPI